MEKARISSLFVVVLHICFVSTLVLGDAPTEGLIAHWNFDEGTGDIAYDSAGYNDGTLVNGPVWTTGRIDLGLDFDGVDDYVSVPDDSSLDFASGENFSVAAWFRIEAGETSGEPILQKYSNSNQSGYALFGNSGFVPGRIAFVTWGTGEIAALDDGGYNDGSWHYAVGVRSQSSGKIQLYIDGVEVDSNNEPSRSLANSANLHIGTNFTGHSNLYGKIDDVRVYDRTLSAEEIWDLYLAGAGPIAHWKFDEGEGDIAYDSAGDNDGTIYGAQWASGIIDGALDFNGVNDYVDVGNDNSLKPPLPVTLSAWIKLSSLGSYQHIITLDDTTSNYYGIWFYVKTEGNLAIGYGDGGSKEPENRRTKHGMTELNTDTWYHIAAIVRGPMDINLCINGADDGGTYSGTGGSLTYSSASSLIGMRHNSQYFLDGQVDDVRVYDQALSAEEIQELYLEGLAVVAVDIKPGSCPNPLNVTSKGVLPVAILGTEDFDVNSIDAVSILLAGVDPIRSAYEDVAEPVPDGNECECAEEGPDGYTDLTLKFKTPEIVEALVNMYGGLIEGEVLALPLTGVLSDGTPIEGADCVRIVGKVPRSLAAKKSDVNEDGIVNILDFSTMAEYWLESAETCY